MNAFLNHTLRAPLSGTSEEGCRKTVLSLCISLSVNPGRAGAGQVQYLIGLSVVCTGES